MSPKDLNNPSFRYVTYDPNTITLKDYTDYNFDLSSATASNPPKWNMEYTFSTQYGVQGMTYNDYLNLYNQLSGNSGTFNNWLNFEVGQSTQDFPSFPDNYYLCSMTSATNEQFADCTSDSLHKIVIN